MEGKKMFEKKIANCEELFANNDIPYTKGICKDSLYVFTIKVNYGTLRNVQHLLFMDGIDIVALVNAPIRDESSNVTLWCNISEEE